VIRRGKTGHFCDKALEGVSHHAVIPNVNVMDSLEGRLTRLSDDEKRLFALICRSYLAAVMPDFEYRQTVVTMQVPVAELVPVHGPGAKAEFRAVGRIPLVQGWKAAFGSAEPEPEKSGKDAKKGDDDAEQLLPNLSDGQSATLTRPKVQAKVTIPPARYNEGTLVDAMQNAWRFVKDEALRERLKEAKGIGTPATRAQIITGLKRQNMLAASGKLVVPTDAGLQLFEVLRGAAPALVDPGTTAIWEMRLDDVVLGRADFRAVIDEIADEADRMITVLRAHTGTTVDLQQKAAGGKAKRSSYGGVDRKPGGLRGTARPTTPKAMSADGDKPKRPRKPTATTTEAPVRSPPPSRAASDPGPPDHAYDNMPHYNTSSYASSSYERSAAVNQMARRGPVERFTSKPNAAPRSGAKPPTEKMIAFAQKLAKSSNSELPKGYDRDFETCRRFLDQNSGKSS
jgi:DNA topoisomerase III